MRLIDENNINDWLFDHFEGNLSGEETNQLMGFLEGNPKFQADFNAWGGSYVQEPEMLFPGMEDLLADEKGAAAPRSWFKWGIGIGVLLFASSVSFWLLPQQNHFGFNASGLLLNEQDHGTYANTNKGLIASANDIATTQDDNTTTNTTFNKLQQQSADIQGVADQVSRGQDHATPPVSDIASVDVSDVDASVNAEGSQSNQAAAILVDGHNTTPEQANINEISPSEGENVGDVLLSNGKITFSSNFEVSMIKKDGNEIIVAGADASEGDKGEILPSEIRSRGGVSGQLLAEEEYVSRVLPNAVRTSSDPVLASIDDKPGDELEYKSDVITLKGIKDVFKHTKGDDKKVEEKKAGEGNAAVLAENTDDKKKSMAKHRHNTRKVIAVNMRDPYFTNPGASAILVNPSFVGTLPGTRIKMNTRSDWTVPTNGGYLTQTLSIDRYMKGLRGGIGLVTTYQMQGDESIIEHGIDADVFTASLIYSPKFKISKRTSLEPSVRGTFVQKEIKSVELESGQLMFGDYSMGLLVNSEAFFAGLTVDHLTEPYDNFENTSSLARTYSVQAGCDFKSRIENDFTFSPHAIYKTEAGNNREVWLGATTKYKWLLFGAGLSNKNQYSGMVGVQSNKFRFGYHYDLSRAPINNAAAGSHEISLRLLLIKNVRTIETLSFNALR